MTTTLTNTLAKLKADGLEYLEHNTMPSSRDEEWKYTSLRKFISTERLSKPSESKFSEVTLPSFYNTCSGSKLIIENGVLNTEKSTISTRHIQIGKIDNDNPFVGKAIQLPNFFTKLNDAHFTEGLHIRIHGQESQALNIFNLYSGDCTIYPRILITADRSASATINIFNSSNNDSNYVINTSEVFLEENAEIHINSLNDNSKNLVVVNTLEAQCKSNARFFHNSFISDSLFIRNNTHARLMGQNAYASLTGFCHTDEESLADQHVFIDHQVPNCESSQLFKSLIDDKSTVVFNGKIMVHVDAQKTNAFQSSKAVLLSEQATIQSKPQLEIFADDVKCSHGAAIGQINKNELFYFKARGIDEETAKAILNFAFASDVIEKIKDEEVKEFLLEKLKADSNLDF